ncbi:hypothetical protein S40285_04523 [Stachybotrys chlorohalonatus IBT 40285]|uniref:PABS domain-containing protein n=1 Tax=Stachybotrys chlorohalonatus (strain IBT 40285) TaxID=1283841 RepID=A0A084QC15_STAC4|nr:hypothetical protein S40285_04523 [Stachybotrys chlorohalonata IBT 40285]
MSSRRSKAKADKPASPAAPRQAKPQDANYKKHEADLINLANKAKANTWDKKALQQTYIAFKALTLIALLATYSSVSQLALSPVYGSIPSAIYHYKLTIAGCFIGWSTNVILNDNLPIKTEEILPIYALTIPAIQAILYGFSDQLGPRWGPVVTEALTLGPVTILSAATIADYLTQIEIGWLPSSIAESLPGIASWGILRLAEKEVAGFLSSHVGTAFVYTRLGLELVLAGLYTIFAPSRWVLLALPALFHTAFLNPHVQTTTAMASLQEALTAQNITLIDRQESVTGYISVIENSAIGWRLMRCDHSLLGGEWVYIRGVPIPVKEPVYSVFLMLEAVRLVETEVPVADKNAKALVIGLGVGTTPTALVDHGINTTVVEIDPVVHDFAVKHFGLRENNPAVLEDAVSYTTKLVKEAPETYDYIVHDVFTGGAEPVDLFTLEFLQGLNSLLKPEGVIAINYAGDFRLPAPKVVVRTILEVFPACRVFRESAADEETADKQGQDFINTVIFCRKIDAPLTFRPAVEADFLKTRGRAIYLEPKFEVDVQELLGAQDEWGILRKNRTEMMAEWHVTSATGHWRIMRQVVPPRVWELW